MSDPEARSRRERVARMWVVAAVLAAAWAHAEPPTTLRFSFWGNFQDLELWRAVAQRFEAHNPDIKLKLEFITGEYGRKLVLTLVSRTAADIILMDDENCPAYTARGYLADLAPFIERDKAELRLDEFLPTSLESFNYRGVQTGLPWDGFALVMYYNRELFREAGIPDPPPDWTWDDFRAIARKLTKDKDGDGRPDQFGTNLMFSLLGFEPILWSFGGAFLNPERTASAFDSPEALEAIQFVYDLKYKDHSITWAGELVSLMSEVQLLTGKVGMTMGAAYLMIVLDSVEEGMEWGVAPMPIGPRGDRYTRVSWDGVSINAFTPHKEEAWRFCKFLVSEEVQELVGRSGRGVPVREADARKWFAKSADRPPRPHLERAAEIQFEAMQYGRLTPITPKFLELQQVVNGICDLLNTEYSGYERDRAKITPTEAVKRLDKAVDRVMEEELARWGADEEPRGNGARATGSVWAEALSLALVPALIAAGLGAAALISARFRRRAAAKWWDLRDMMRSRMGRSEAGWGVALAGPWLLGVCLFTLFPIGFSVLLSFSDWDPYDPVANRTFVGWANYREAVFEDPLVAKALWNTFFYAFFAAPLCMAASLGLALLLNQKLRGIAVFRTIFYVPTIVGGVATSILWLYIFNPVFGPLNGLLRWMNRLLDATFLAFIDLPQPGWVMDPLWAKPAVIVMALWTSGGAGMLVFLAGLQGVPHQLYEAADLDGANRWRKFWHVTLPMLTPTIYFNLIIGIIGALQAFMQAYVMTDGKGGIDKSLLFYVLYLYQKAFVEFEMGYACALAWILFVIILAFTMLIVKSSALWVYYEGERPGGA